MNKTRYNDLIKFPFNFSQEDVIGLEKLKNDFPYSQAIRALYLKSLLESESVNFDKELRITAAYTINRKALKTFLFTNTPVLVKVNEKEVEKSVSNESTTNTSFNTSNTEIETPKKEKEIISTPSTSLDKASDNAVLTEAINASILQDIDREKSTIKTLVNSLESKQQKTAEKKSFLDWITKYDQERKSKERKQSEFRSRAEALIDEFISNQPKITPKREFYSPVNMADASVTDSHDVASETLAKVYLAQGNLSNAIKCYETLILKFPEKKTYFASAIELAKKNNKQ